MFGDFNIILAQNSLYDSPATTGGFIEQKNCFKVHMDTDLNIKTITETSVLLYSLILDVETQLFVDTYVDCNIIYSRRDISIVPRENLIPGHTYKIAIKSGESGVKDVFGSSLEADIIYDIIFNNRIIIARPNINTPVNNSTVDSVLISINKNGADSCLIEIDDNMKFVTPLFSEEVTLSDFDPIADFKPTFAFEPKQYYIRARAKKTFVDELTHLDVVGESEFTKIQQFFYEVANPVGLPSEIVSTVNIVKQRPEDGESLVSNKTIMFFADTDLTGKEVTMNVYTSELGLYDFYKDDITSVVELLTLETGTKTVHKNLVRFELDEIKLSSAYYITLVVSNIATVEGIVTVTGIINEKFSFTTSSRILYVDYDYMKTSVSNFEITQEVVMEKIQRACDMADYLSTSKIRPDKIAFKVKEYVRNKALLDILADYQLGYVQMVGGKLGSFEFSVSGANVDSIGEAMKYLKAQIKYWETALKGYEKQGNAAPEYAVKNSASSVARGTF